MFRAMRTTSLWSIMLCVLIVAAQVDTCPEIVEEALDAVDTYCSGLERNQACYGNVLLAATAQAGIEDFVFEGLGDVVDVAAIDTLELSPMNEDAGEWGVAVMSLQVDIPDTLPGQNVTFILYGDVMIENAADDDQNPMQAFYLRTGVSDAGCEEAPESGLLVQTPEGVEEVTFNVNGVDVAVGSTVMFQAVANEEMSVTTVEGTAVLDFENEVYPAIEGTELRLPLNEQLLPTGRPDLPASYDENRVRPLPVRPLPRAIGVAPPLPQGDLETLNGRLRDGQPPCGVPGLPACDRLPPQLRDAPPLPPPDRWGAQFVPGENCILPEEFVPGAPPPEGQDRPLPPCPPSERPPRPDGLRLWCVVLPGPDDPPLPDDEDRPICPNNEPIAPEGSLPPPPEGGLPPPPPGGLPPPPPGGGLPPPPPPGG